MFPLNQLSFSRRPVEVFRPRKYDACCADFYCDRLSPELSQILVVSLYCNRKSIGDVFRKITFVPVIRRPCPVENCPRKRGLDFDYLIFKINLRNVSSYPGASTSPVSVFTNISWFAFSNFATVTDRLPALSKASVILKMIPSNESFGTY